VARNFSRCRNLINGRWSGRGTSIKDLSWVQEQKLRSVATKSRLGGAKSVTTASAEALAKAEQLTHIVRVRVSVSDLFFCLG